MHQYLSACTEFAYFSHINIFCHFFQSWVTGYRLAAEVNRQHSECVCIYTHTLRVLPIHFGRETVPSVFELHHPVVLWLNVVLSCKVLRKSIKHDQ